MFSSTQFLDILRFKLINSENFREKALTLPEKKNQNNVRFFKDVMKATVTFILFLHIMLTDYVKEFQSFI